MQVSRRIQLLLACALALSLFSGSGRAAQLVSGLKIEYARPFVFNEHRSRTWLENLPREKRTFVSEYRVYEAPSPFAIGELRIVKAIETDFDSTTLDRAAYEAAESLSRLRGMTNPTSQVTSMRISGRDARRLSYEADRFDGRIGAEHLIIYDRKNRTKYMVQTVFGIAKRGAGSTDLSASRTQALRLLETVTIAE